MINGIKKVAAKLFSTNIGSNLANNVTPYATKKITTDMTNYLNRNSQFGEMTEEEIYENLMANEPDIGAGIDKLSTMVSRSFKAVTIETDEEMTEDETETLRLAKEIVKNMDIHSKLETYTELLIMHGAVCGEYKNGSLIIHPNKYITFIDSLDRSGVRFATDIIDDPKYMLVYESDPMIDTKTISRGRYVHIKYKDTPVFALDMMGRNTYGIYPVSPLQRLIATVWHKRQLVIIDVKHRWRNVPREHHKIAAEAFALSGFTGNTMAEKLVNAGVAAETAITAHNAKLTDMEPDQSITTLDNFSIDVIETRNKYTESNALIEQLDKNTWLALNMPESIVNGNGAGSYASEVNVGNYFSTKVIEIATKFEPILLRMIRDKIKMIDPSLPVDKLNLVFELSMSSAKIELFRQCAIMISTGQFTSKEIRDVVGYDELTDIQKENLVSAGQEKTVGDVMRDTGRMTDVPEYPDTPHSDEKHKNDVGQRAENKSMFEIFGEDLSTIKTIVEKPNIVINTENEELMKNKNKLIERMLDDYDELNEGN